MYKEWILLRHSGRPSKSDLVRIASDCIDWLTKKELLTSYGPPSPVIQQLRHLNAQLESTAQNLSKI